MAMEIMTEEYCRQCPFFIEDKGWMKDDDHYWTEHPDSACVCKRCPRQYICEAYGSPTDIGICLVPNYATAER